MRSYKNKTVVITGGATGISFALANAFGLDGANIIIAGIRVEKIETAVTVLQTKGITAKGTICDVANIEEVEALAEFAQTQFGGANVLVNNAGIGSMPAPLAKTDMNEFARIIDVNLMGVVNGCRVFSERFKNQDGAAIYNVGSENSFFAAVPMSYAYIASKHAVLAITELLAEELAGKVEVKLIVPGAVATDLTTMLPNTMPADDFAKTVMTQLKAKDNFYVVSHAYNAQRIADRQRELQKAYTDYAPRHEGDEALDVRIMLGLDQA